MKLFYDIKAKADEAEIYIYDFIGEDLFSEGVTAKAFADELKALKGKALTVRINSPGGSVWDGMAIHSQLSQHQAPVTVKIEGLAASIASVIALAGDRVEIAEGGFMMIHDPWTMAMGTVDNLMQAAAMLEKIKGSIVEIYAKKTKKPYDEIAAMMAAETWMTGAEAVVLGFADSVMDTVKPQSMAKFDLQNYKNPPQALLSQAEAKEQVQEPDLTDYRAREIEILKLSL